LVLYRPDTGIIYILEKSGDQFRAVYPASRPGTGIGGYDLANPADRVFAFDYQSPPRPSSAIFRGARFGPAACRDKGILASA